MDARPGGLSIPIFPVAKLENRQLMTLIVDEINDTVCPCRSLQTKGAVDIRFEIGGSALLLKGSLDAVAGASIAPARKSRLRVQTE